MPVIDVNGEAVFFPDEMSEEDIIKAIEGEGGQKESATGWLLENVPGLKQISGVMGAIDTGAQKLYEKTGLPGALGGYFPPTLGEYFQEAGPGQGFAIQRLLEQSGMIPEAAKRPMSAVRREIGALHTPSNIAMAAGPAAGVKGLVGLGLKGAGLAMSPLMIGQAYDLAPEALETYRKEGASQKFYDQVVEATGSTLFAALLISHIARGKNLKEAVKDAGEEAKGVEAEKGAGGAEAPDVVKSAEVYQQRYPSNQDLGLEGGVYQEPFKAGEQALDLGPGEPLALPPERTPLPPDQWGGPEGLPPDALRERPLDLPEQPLKFESNPLLPEVWNGDAPVVAEPLPARDQAQVARSMQIWQRLRGKVKAPVVPGEVPTKKYSSWLTDAVNDFPGETEVTPIAEKNGVRLVEYPAKDGGKWVAAIPPGQPIPMAAAIIDPPLPGARGLIDPSSPAGVDILQIIKATGDTRAIGALKEHLFSQNPTASGPTTEGFRKSIERWKATNPPEEMGFGIPNSMLASLGRGVNWAGGLMRALAAGQPLTAARNFLFGGKDIVMLAAELRGAAAMERDPLIRKRYRLISEKLLTLGPEEVTGTLADIGQILAHAVGRKGKPVHSTTLRLEENLDFMKKWSENPREAGRVWAYTTSEVNPRTSLERIALIPTILGDRMINRTVIRAYMDSFMESRGLKDLAELDALASTDAGVKADLQRFLGHMENEALRASFQQDYLSPEMRARHARFHDSPVRNIFALGTVPFARSVFANFIPRLFEAWPGINRLSPRVSASMAHEGHLQAKAAAQAEMVQVKKALGAAAPSDPAYISAKQALDRESAWLREHRGEVYDPKILKLRAWSGPAMVTAFFLRRLMVGDDGTEHDTAATKEQDGRATQTVNFNSILGPDGPGAALGDYLGYYAISLMTGTPFRYEGKGEQDFVSRVLQGAQKTLKAGVGGSRGGAPNPALDLFREWQRGSFDPQNIKQIVERWSAEMGRMAGIGSYAGYAARVMDDSLKGEKAKLYRRTDVLRPGTDWSEAITSGFSQGVRSQIPGVKEALPLSPSWAELRPGRALGIPGGELFSRNDVAPIEDFVASHQGQINFSEVLPKRHSDDPEFDDFLLEKWSGLANKILIPLLSQEKFLKLSEKGKVELFRIRAQAVREAAYGQATGAYIKGMKKRPVALEEEIRKARELGLSLRGR